MDEIRLRQGVKVKVNEQGDTITLNVEDQQFSERFYSLLERLSAAEDYLKSPEVKEMTEHEQLKESIRLTREIMGEMDVIFGEKSCKKVFGDIVPNMYLIADFFRQIDPIAEKYMGERRREIEQRYGRNRKEARNRSRHRNDKRNRQRGRDELIQDAKENADV
ncbi:MAG: hypothetical protein NC399_06400 [Muribaculum sp.]|nr:hypothetical protein [Muribaculum sp.]